jgi:hypothetical protein
MLPIALEARAWSTLNPTPKKRQWWPEFPVRSLLDVIHFVDSGNGIIPGKPDGDSLRRESQQFFVDF